MNCYYSAFGDFTCSKVNENINIAEHFFAPTTPTTTATATVPAPPKPTTATTAPLPKFGGPVNGYKFLQSYDTPGNNITSFYLQQLNIPKNGEIVCGKICDASPICKSFTYGDNMCILKKSQTVQHNTPMTTNTNTYIKINDAVAPYTKMDLAKPPFNLKNTYYPTNYLRQGSKNVKTLKDCQNECDKAQDCIAYAVRFDVNEKTKQNEINCKQFGLPKSGSITQFRQDTGKDKDPTPRAFDVYARWVVPPPLSK